jgi:hypothetical protein
MKTGLMAGGIALLATLGLSYMAFAGPAVDSDGDGVYDVLDNCVNVQNASPNDCDTDNDGYGNYCDGDFDQDMFTAPSDFTVWYNDFSTSGYDGGTGTDMDCDGYVAPNDFTLWYNQFSTTGSPGPSGLSCAGSVPCDL